MPLACTPVLGRSVIERIVGELKRTGVEAITVLADNMLAPTRIEVERGSSEVVFNWVTDAWSNVAQVAEQYKQSGIEWTFIIQAGQYFEIDPLRMLHFHRSQSQGITRALDDKGALSVWLADTVRIQKSSVSELLGEAARYQVQGYVNRLRGPKDFRQLVVDGLTSRCKLRPQGTEVRAAVWIEKGAQVDKRARIVGPAFVGRGSKIGEQCLITRCSNVESNCEVDYGTIVENSSILADTYVGIGLDVSHSIIQGNTLLNLERDVKLTIADPAMIRKTKVFLREWNQRPSVGIFGVTERGFRPQEQE